MAGTRAFREAFLSAGASGDSFSDFDARRTRYALLWAYYESTAYRVLLHPWATKYLTDHALYKYIRNIYNPSARLAETWVQFLVGGALDEAAGDKGALPIVLPKATPEETANALRAAIAQVWRDSVWQVNKSIWARNGIVMGDSGLRVVDDTKRKKVYLEVVKPDIIKDVVRDPFGSVKKYELEEMRADPRGKSGEVKYTEIGERVASEGQNPGGRGIVRFKTLLNDQLYAWNGEAAEWEENYGFVPFLVTRHIDLGLPWGWSEMHTSLAKLRELDDQASVVDDYIRKAVNAPWLFNFAKPRTDPTLRTGTPSDETREPGREQINSLYIANAEAKAQALVANLDLEPALNNIAKLIEQLERDFPELQADVFKLGSDASGRALRTLREPVEARATERRAAYEDALVRAQQMAISIGAQRGYEGFAAFNEESFKEGKLAHSIGRRPVFRQDPLDDLEFKKAFWETAQTAQAAGQPLEEYLREAGWDEERISKVIQNPEYVAKRLAMVEAFGGTNSPAERGNG